MCASTCKPRPCRWLLSRFRLARMLMGREHSASSKDHRRFSLHCVTDGIYGGGCRRAWGSYSLVVITAKPYEIMSALRCASTTGPRRSSRRYMGTESNSCP
ncbi:hypothetical protein BS78_10G134300 [Paspalum vaginatum]|nr:hypothetical protein BS78_10G134300 [Paspalum vaginatum]